MQIILIRMTYDYGKGLSTHMASISIQPDNCGVSATASPNAGALYQLPP